MTVGLLATSRDRHAGGERGIAHGEEQARVGRENLGIGSTEGHGDRRQVHDRLGADAADEVGRGRGIVEVEHDLLGGALLVASPVDGDDLVTALMEHAHDAAPQSTGAARHDGCASS